MTKRFKIVLASIGIFLGITGISTGIIAHNLNKKQVNIFSLEKPKQLIKVSKLNISEKFKNNKKVFLKKQEINLPKFAKLESTVVEKPRLVKVYFKKHKVIKTEKNSKIDDDSNAPELIEKLKSTNILKWVIKNPYKTAGIVSGAIVGVGIVGTATFFTTLFIKQPREFGIFLELLKILNKEDAAKWGSASTNIPQTK
ncbi:hypothetical protein QLQ80_01955 [Mycoplasma sp. M5725]|uniref:Uncharacterized protein n=1 Tax=Mycoplasma phocimorsus TaxID=3045839 RepID=A0AAJ1UWZ6_9MOLU|nr:hypothetical protein [Mycoplasma phocimorsus]MDJ1645850.1 hypothetical protein [Mycoplasma phocimorsus]MDJ1648004.1 hypothetical protein [Mycoplasma phocimorsus]